MATEYVILTITSVAAVLGYFISRDKTRQEADIAAIRAKQEADIAAIRAKQEADILAANTRFENGTRDVIEKHETLQKETNKALNDIALALKEISFLVTQTVKDAQVNKDGVDIRIKENHEEILRIRDWRHEDAQWKQSIVGEMLKLNIRIDGLEKPVKKATRS